MPACTFARLRDILAKLGFRACEAGSSLVFEHPAASARLYLDRLPDGETVDQATLVVVRRNLDERGILSRAGFEELLREQSLAG